MKIKIPTNTGQKCVFTGQQEAGSSDDKNRRGELSAWETFSCYKIYTSASLEYAEGWGDGEPGRA